MNQWTKLYLRAADRDEMFDALETAGLSAEREDGTRVVISNHQFAVADLGVLSEPTGEVLTDDEGLEYPEIAQIPGYHFNVKHHPDIEPPAPLVAVQVHPASPRVGWAGDDAP